jgi:hypothetical protein
MGGGMGGRFGWEMVWGYVRLGDFSGMMKGFSWVIFILLKLKIFECLDKSYFCGDGLYL